MFSDTWFMTTCLAVVAILLAILARPDQLFRLLAWGLRLTVVRARCYGDGEIPRKGPALLVSNHVAFFDALMILGMTTRRVHFMVHEDFFRYTPLRLFFRYLGILKVPSARHPRAMRAFFEQVHALLRAGEAVCVFPEGGVSDNGLLQHFHEGIRELLPEGVHVPVIPIRLGMLWGRLFTLDGNRLKFIPPRRMPIEVTVTVGQAVSPELTGFQLRQVISEMGAETEKKPFPGELPIHIEFLRRARRRPWRRTFRDFEAPHELCDFAMLVRALVLSRKIRELDPNPSGGFIGILLPNCNILAATVLGVMYADRTPAILNYSAGSAAMREAVRKADIQLTLTSRKFLEKLGLEPSPEMVCLEDLAKGISAGLKRQVAFEAALLPWRLLAHRYAPESRYDLGRTAVLLFSSGSTGTPKGVELTYRNINSNIFSFWRGINWSPQDRIIGSLPLFHAFGFTVCFCFPALSGTRVVYLPNILDAAQVVRLVEEERITLMITTPTFLQHYMRKATSAQFRTLRLVITGAEKLRSDIAGKFHDLTGLSIVEGYGCTELSPIVSINLSSSFLALGRQAGRPDSVGAPMPGVHVKIADPETGKELPPDQPGMLLVKGGLVMRGYLHDPEATAAVMEGDFYRTGDIAAMSTDGYLTITGRLARFSKIGGEMVPHELVERAISEYLECDGRKVAVIGVPDARRGEKLLVFHTLENLRTEELLTGLRCKELPNLWIPKPEDFIRVERLPLLGSGKLDLQHLRALADRITRGESLEPEKEKKTSTATGGEDTKE